MEERIEPNIDLSDTVMIFITPSCLGNQHATYICLTEGCTDNAMMCDNVECDCNKSKHHTCTTKITVK